MFHVKHGSVPATPEAASLVFGDRLEAAELYARILAGAGVEWGLLGPREVDRVWERHILNSAALGELMEPGSASPTSVVGPDSPGYRWRWRVPTST